MIKSASTPEERRIAFMEATRNVPSYVVTRALNWLTPGANWNGCGKNHLADRFANGTPHTPYIGTMSIEVFHEALSRSKARIKGKQP